MTDSSFKGAAPALPLVEVEAFSEEQKLLVSLLKKMPGSGHLWLARVLADASKVDLLLIHEIAYPDVVKVGGHIDQGVGHDRIPVLGEDLIHKELEPAGIMEQLIC